MNLYFWQQIIKGKKYIVILMVEFLDGMTMAVTVMVCNGFRWHDHGSDSDGL